jgi:hypothetical protein
MNAQSGAGIEAVPLAAMAGWAAAQDHPSNQEF